MFRSYLQLTALILITSAICSGDESLEVDSGATIFATACADCHGADGQGGDGFDQPLFGNESPEELTLLIERTMPEGEPEACAGADAKSVAEFIYSEFYSPAARQEKGLATAPRLEQMRLTVPQYRNSIADLIGQFTPSVSGNFEREERKRRRRKEKKDKESKDEENKDDKPQVPEPEPIAIQESDRGFLARYFESDGMTKTKSLRMERLDRQIDFDFGESGPTEHTKPEQFAVIWQGAITTTDTGNYEFRVTTENGVRLYINLDAGESRGGLRDDSSTIGQSALIDGWVNSGELQERTARLFLGGGRRYPLRLEYFKYMDKSASIRLEWKPPHGVWSRLDAKHVTPISVPRDFVVTTPFPADDRSLGYERGTAVSREWHAATSLAAIEVTNEFVERLPLLADYAIEGKNKTADDEAQRKTKELVLKLAASAFRRPLLESEEKLLGEVLFADGIEPEIATRRAILFTLNSPYFLYPNLAPLGELAEDYAIASRLALSLWDSLPDQELMAATERGDLSRREEVAMQAERMLGDLRAKAKLHGFFHHWLELDERAVVKDRERYPEFDESVMADLRYSLEMFLHDTVWSDSSDLRQLLTADELPLNGRLRKLYGVGEDDQPLPDDEFASVVIAEQQRSGVLTHPYLLSAFAYHDKTSPIHRGVFLTKNIVGRGLKAPPEAVAFKDDEFAPDLTMREKVTQLTSSTACMSCHSIINPLGFALENYDAVGRFRTTENEKPVDTVSEYYSTDGKSINVRNAQDVANFAISSPNAQRAFVAQLFHHVVKQDPLAYDRGLLESLREGFVADEFNIKNLYKEIAIRTALAEE